MVKKNIGGKFYIFANQGPSVVIWRLLKSSIVPLF